MLNIMSVTLINPFEVPPGREEDAVAYWDRCADVLRRQPGFISARLHRAIMPEHIDQTPPGRRHREQQVDGVAGQLQPSFPQGVPLPSRGRRVQTTESTSLPHGFKSGWPIEPRWCCTSRLCIGDQSAPRNQSFIFRAAVVRLTTEEALIPTTARFNIPHANQRLWTHKPAQSVALPCSRRRYL
jgi:hypothetical protein